MFFSYSDLPMLSFRDRRPSYGALKYDLFGGHLEGLLLSEEKKDLSEGTNEKIFKIIFAYKNFLNNEVLFLMNFYKKVHEGMTP